MRSNLPGMTAHPVIADLGAFDFNGFLAGLGAGREHRGAPHGRPGRPDHRRRPGAGNARRRRPAGNARGGDRRLRPALLQAQGERRPACRSRAAGADRRRCSTAVAGPLHITLDGNEQYEDVDAVVDLWSAMEAEPALQQLCAATLFIEQPIKRQVALARSIAPLARFRPVIIDESDGELDAFVRARILGYGGVSSKNCKGFYKSIVNLARCRLWNAEGGNAGYFLSGEDLTTQAGLSVQQDLALVALLGLADVERNGHHFIDGFDGRPQRREPVVPRSAPRPLSRGRPARSPAHRGRPAAARARSSAPASAAPSSPTCRRPRPARSRPGHRAP